MARIAAPALLTVQLVTGTKEDTGASIVQSVSYSKIDNAAQDAVLREVGTILSGLSAYPLRGIVRTDRAELVA